MSVEERLRNLEEVVTTLAKESALTRQALIDRMQQVDRQLSNHESTLYNRNCGIVYQVQALQLKFKIAIGVILSFGIPLILLYINYLLR